MEVISSLTLIKFHVEYLAKLRRNLKTQLYFNSQAYRPHLSVTKTELFENALQTKRNLKTSGFRFCGDEKQFENGAFEYNGVTIIM